MSATPSFSIPPVPRSRISTTNSSKQTKSSSHETPFEWLYRHLPSFQSVVKRVADDGYPMNETLIIPDDHCIISIKIKDCWPLHHYLCTSMKKEQKDPDDDNSKDKDEHDTWEPASKFILECFQHPSARFQYPHASHTDFQDLRIPLPASELSSPSFTQLYLDPTWDTDPLPQERTQLLHASSSSSTLPASCITLDSFSCTFPMFPNTLFSVRLMMYDLASHVKLTPDVPPPASWPIDLLGYPECVLVICVDRPLLPPSSPSSKNTINETLSTETPCFQQPWCFHVIPLAQMAWSQPMVWDSMVLRPYAPLITCVRQVVEKKKDLKRIACVGTLQLMKQEVCLAKEDQEVFFLPWVQPPSFPSLKSHALFIFPSSFTFKKKAKWRNLTCSIEVYNGLHRIPCIYASTLSSKRLGIIHTRVWYHEKNPFFEDEIKIDLPLDPTGHFLKFTFYNVTCKPKQAGQLTCLGYSLFFLSTPTGHYANDGAYTFAVVPNLPIPLTTTLAGPTDLVVFDCAFRYASALVVSQPRLYAFFVHDEVPTVLDLDLACVRPYLPMVLLHLVALPSTDTVAFLLRCLSASSTTDLVHFLRTFIRALPPLTAWVLAVRERLHPWVSYVWFLGTWVVRSLALAPTRVHEWVQALTVLVTEISKLVYERSTQFVNEAKQLNNQLSYFIRDLMPLFPFSQIQTWLSLHLHAVSLSSPIIDIQLKLDCLSILSGFEHPFPMAYVISQCLPYVYHDLVELRLTAIFLLRNILCLRAKSLPLPLCIYLLECLFPCLPMLNSNKEGSESVFLRTLGGCIVILLPCVPEKYTATWVFGFMDIASWMNHLKPLLDLFHYPSEDSIRDRLTTLRQVLHARKAKHHLEDRFKSFAPLPPKTKNIKGQDPPLSTISSDDIEQEYNLSNHVMLTVVSFIDVLLTALSHKTFASFMLFMLEFLNLRMRPNTLRELVLRLIRLVRYHPSAILDFHLDPFLKSCMSFALSSDSEIRALGARLLLSMFQTCFVSHLSEFTSFRIHVTRTIAKLSLAHAHTMQLCLEAMQQQVGEEKLDDDAKHSAFLEEMKNVVDSLSQVIRNRVKLDTILDFESKLACFHQIANGYFNTPDLRLDTLCAMCDLHASNGRYTEATFACLHAAALVSEFLLHRFPNQPGSVGAKAFLPCNPNLIQEVMTTTSFHQHHFVSPLFSEVGLSQLVQRAIGLCIQAQLYETLIVTSKLLFPIYEMKKEWKLLAELHLTLSQAFQTLSTSSSKQTMNSNYFRVAFLGEMWDEDLKNQVYVYRMDSGCTLRAFSEEMKSTFHFLGEALSIYLGPTDPPDHPAPNTALLHITPIEPLPSSSPHSALSPDMVDQFEYLVPCTLDTSMPYGAMASQCLRQIHLTTVHPFPYLVNRLPLLSVTHETLPPIQVATQGLNARTSVLMQLLTHPVETPKLQRMLHMVLELPVDQGPVDMVNVFLTPPKVSEHRPEDVVGLKQALSAFLRQCELGVTVTRQVVVEDGNNIQETLEEKLEELRTILEPHLLSAMKMESKVNEEEEKMLKRVEAFLGSNIDLTLFLSSE